MPQPSDAFNLFSNIQAEVANLGLTFGSPPVLVAVEIKKHGFWTAGVSLPNLPIILIVGEDKPESVTPWASEDQVLAKYMATILTIAAGNKDNTANLDIWWNWREQERRLFQWSMQPTIDNCFFIEFIGDPPLLREAFLKNYDVSAFGLRMWNVEPRIGPIV